MIYLVAILLPPLYFALKGRWLAAIIHSMIFLFALVLILATLGLGSVFAVPLWMISVVCAVWDLRKQLMEEQATMMASKMVEAMQKQPLPSAPASRTP